MFLINGFNATLKQFNRSENDDIFDDQKFEEIQIKICPYDGERAIYFSKYTISEAKGYYTVPGNTKVKVGDQIIFENEIVTVLEVGHNYLFNRIENYTLAVK